MAPVIYGSALGISVICSAIYIFLWHKHFDANLTMIFMLVPISNLGFFVLSTSTTLEGALLATKMTYIGGCFLPFFVSMSVFALCRVEIKRWIRLMLFLVCTICYLSVLSAGHLDLFYKSFTLETYRNGTVLSKEYGFMHTVFYVVMFLFFAAGMYAIVYSWMRKKEAPRTVILLLVIPEVITILGYFIGKILNINVVETVPVCYVLAQIIYIIIATRVTLYDIGDTVIDSMIQEKELGYISFDFRYRFLGCNDTARMLVPELAGLSVDDVIGYKPSERRIRHYLENFKEKQASNSFLFHYKSETGKTEDDRYYNVNVNYLYDGNRKRGYIIIFTDDTENRKYISLLDTYNENLQTEVEEKTKHIVQMHDNLIMSLAMMVESRDNSTGGHIKRTSTGVRILIDEIMKEGELTVSDEFCRDVIKAAPMHDLGKIAVDDAVLRKPGRFTDEEYEKMKRHSAEGARVIHEILRNTDDESFKVIAENVAHYHHERWDGSGYPERLAGNAIPLEARIMAIADVYDALVSRRVYKEAFSFEKADEIIMEGMGSQFDPGLKSAYMNARPRLEEYYGRQGLAE